MRPAAVGSGTYDVAWHRMESLFVIHRRCFLRPCTKQASARSIVESRLFWGRAAVLSPTSLRPTAIRAMEDALITVKLMQASMVSR